MPEVKETQIIKFKQPVSQITIKRDENLKADNIREGVVIEGVYGLMREPKPHEYDMNSANSKFDSEGKIKITNEVKDGDFYVAIPMSEVTLLKNNNLIPENIKKDVDINGIVGTLESPTIAEKYQLDMNKVTYDEAGLGILTMTQPPKQIVVAKDSDLEPYNIKNGITIEGITGTLKEGEPVSTINVNLPYNSISYQTFLQAFYGVGIAPYINFFVTDKILYDTTGNPVNFVDDSTATTSLDVIIFSTKMANDYPFEVGVCSDNTNRTFLRLYLPAGDFFFIDEEYGGSIQFCPEYPLFMEEESITLASATFIQNYHKLTIEEARESGEYFFENEIPSNTKTLPIYVNKEIIDKGMYMVNNITITCRVSDFSNLKQCNLTMTITGVPIK